MTRSTLVAVAVFCALGVAFLATREPQVAVGVRKLNLAPVKAEAITSLQLGDLTLWSEGPSWKVARGGQGFAADPAAITPLTKELAEIRGADFVTDKPEKHAELEVDAAKGRAVKASTAGGTVRDLVLGKTSKSGGVYAREASSNEVFVVQGSLGWQARQELTAWRQKRIELAPREELEKVTLAPAGGDPVVLAVDGGEVKLDGPTPPGYRFDADAANQLVGQLVSLVAQEFTEDTVPSPAFTITLALKGGRTRTLSFGPRRGDGGVPLRADGDPQSYVLPGWTAQTLLRDREGLRDLKLQAFTGFDAERATLTSAGRKVVVEKKGDAWTLVEPKALPAGFEFDPSSVEPQLRQLASTRALRTAKDDAEAKAGLAKPVAQLELKLKGGDVRRISIGAKLGDRPEHLARGQDPFPVVVAASVLSTLERGLELFKKQPAPQPMGLDQLPPELRAQLEAQLRKQQVSP
jgi:hypothetical protein